MSESNPFPTYQTVNLTDSPEQVHKRTVETPEIGRARKLLEEYEKHFGAEVSKIPHRPILVAVAGDYGTGKTHLLMEVASQFNKLKAFDGIILSWIAPEDTPSAWFRAQPNPLNNVPFEAIMEAVFNQVAIKVAQSSKLTRKHADEIKEDPEVLSDLFAAGKINFSVVDEAYHKEISKICGPNVSADVQNAFAALASNSSSDLARSWLTGVTILEDDRINLRVKQTGAGDDEIYSILVALAAFYAHLSRPLALLIDELEHFADYDRSQNEKRNLTWLKRLLEAVAPFSPLVFVAGHSSSWELEPNLLVRFTEEIRMLVLSQSEILNLLRLVVPDLPRDYAPQAEAIQEVTGGRMRAVLTLCSALWEESGHFRRAISPDRIRFTAANGKAGVSGTRAIDEIQSVLQEKSFSVRRSATIANNLEFDLVGFRSGAPNVVFDFKYADTPVANSRELRRFLDKVTEVLALFPNLLACLLAEGNTDQNLQEIAKSSIRERLAYFDLNTPNVLTRIRQTLDSHISTAQIRAVTPAEALITQTRIIDRQLAQAAKDDDGQMLRDLREQRLALDKKLEEEVKTSVDARTVELQKRLESLESKQREEYKKLEMRAYELADSTSSPREKAIADAIVGKPDLREKTYDEIVAEYLPNKALRVMISNDPNFIIAIGYVILGAVWTYALLFLIPVRDLFPSSFTVLIGLGFGIIAVVTGVGLIIYRAMSAQRFLNHGRRLMRELYLRSATAQELSTADRLLQELLAVRGPSSALLRAREALAKEFPMFDTSRVGSPSVPPLYDENKSSP
jgi:Cdc6-like AAA superfamily ATPase